VTHRTCPLCSADLAPGVELDARCTGRTLGLLHAAPGLLRELDVTITRQSSRGETNGGEGLAFHPQASEASGRLRAVLRVYAAEWGRTTPIRGEQAPVVARLLGSPAGQAALLASSKLQRRTWAPDLAHDLDVACELAERWIDRPPSSTFVGWCECRRALYVAEGRTTGRCPGCLQSFSVDESRLAMLARLPGIREQLLTKPQLAALCGLPVGTLHRWSSEGRIVSSGYTEAGRPMFPAGPVIEAALTGIPPAKVAPAAPDATDQEEATA
jgi:hypothetical protein